VGSATGLRLPQLATLRRVRSELIHSLVFHAMFHA
jgi:hypothetical protein